MAEFDPERLRSVLGEALELPPDRQEEFVRRAAGDDERLRSEVMRLLAKAADVPPGFLEIATERRDRLEGARLGDFTLLREIGRGAVGAVYLAHQRALDRQVAIKVFEESPFTTARHIERFHREARAAARLRHPNIVPVHAEGQDGRVHWFAMEHVPGHDLATELAAQRNAIAGMRPILPPPGARGRFAAIARLAADVADALQHAHDAGLVHRDVKPANLLLHPDGRVQIGDFGISRDFAEASLTHTGELQGTPYYMSPEQAHALSAPIDHRTDVYSLGVVLYEMLTLRRPFDGATSVDVIVQIRDKEPRSPRRHDPKVPRDLELICQTAMAKRPAARYATAGELAADLRRFLGHEAIVAAPPSLRDRAAHFARRHRGAFAAAALVIAGAVGGSVYREALAADRSLARVSVELRGADGAPLSGTAMAYPLDARTGMPAPDGVALGTLPVRGAKLEPGDYRIVLRAPTGETAELARRLDTSQPTEITARAAPAARRHGMVTVEGGTLALRDPDRPNSQLNHLDVEVPTFQLDAREVSNADYRRFLEDTGRAPPSHWSEVRWGEHDDLPVVKVSWWDARAYAEWAGKRLPTLAELTWAGRGADGRRYPWGPEPGEMPGNVHHARQPGGGLTVYLDCAAPVASHPAACSPDGVHHLFGNVAELTETALAARDEQDVFQPRPLQRVVFGAAWDAAARGQSLASLGWVGTDAGYADFQVGFRCASSFP